MMLAPDKPIRRRDDDDGAGIGHLVLVVVFVVGWGIGWLVMSR